MTRISQAILAIAFSFLSLSAFACQDFKLEGTVLTIECPGVNLEGQMPPGAVMAPHPDARTGKPASNLIYPDNQALFQGAKVYLCHNKAWTCGGGNLRNVLNGNYFAQGEFQGNKAVITLPRAVDPSQLTGVVVLQNGMRGWLHPLH